MVSSAFFALLYTFLSLVLMLGWKCFRLFARGKHLPADILFSLRVVPLGISLGVSFFLIYPSFAVLETRSMDEDLGTFVLGTCALVFLGAGLFRVISAELRTRRIVSACLEGAVDLKRTDFQRATMSPQRIAPLMLVGIRAPRILISEATQFILSDAELQAAVRHEAVHLRARDNLKRAILNFLPFPGLQKVDAAWQAGAELAADDGAVSNRGEALDLASALIKLSRHFAHPNIPNFAVSLVSGGA